jgi:hypothetical protein
VASPDDREANEPGPMKVGISLSKVGLSRGYRENNFTWFIEAFRISKVENLLIKSSIY